MNGNTFSVQVDKFLKQTGIKLETLTKLTAIKIWTSATVRTPVDTGRARASWNLIRGEDADLTVPPESEFPAPGKHAGTGDKRGKMDTAGSVPAFTVSNNVHYIEYLEEGSSKQAPQGMLKLAIAEAIAEIESVIKATNEQT